MCRSKFEHLPDEMLLEICSYLSAFDIIDSFGYLNSRLERTISQFRRDINLQNLTFTRFNRWCSHWLSYTAKSLVKLTLSNWNTPGQIRFFNSYITEYDSIHQLLPVLNQLWLGNFDNADIDILSKLTSLEKVMIDVETQVPLHHSTEICFDRYLFCSPNSQFKELRIYGAEGGIQLQHNFEIIINSNLEQLTVGLSTLDDLILILRRSPNLRKLCIDIHNLSNIPPRQILIPEIMPKYLKHFQLWAKDRRILLFHNLETLLSNMPMLEVLSLEIETTDVDYANGQRWNVLLTLLPYLRRLELGLKITVGFGLVTIDVTPFVGSFENMKFPICCYADSRVLYIDTVPYIFENMTGIMTSPKAHLAKSTDMTAFRRHSRRVHTLCFDGRHEPTIANDWMNVLTRFSRICVLDLSAVNISNKDIQYDENNKQIQLLHLTTLRYVRSTRCKVNLPFFMYLYNRKITPNLRILTIMYGDIVYLCERLPGFIFERIEQLCIYSVGADGLVCFKDINMLLMAFPCLQNFAFQVRSSRNINRHAQQIIDLLVRSQPSLISFRLSCKRGSLYLSALIDDDARDAWVKHMFGLNNSEQVHLLVNKKEVSLWK